jgi:hypothetical protein
MKEKAKNNICLVNIDSRGKNNKKLFLLSCGEDFYSLTFYLSQKQKYSILTPFFEDKNNKAYQHTFRYLEKPHLELSKFLFENCHGIIASDFDYVNGSNFVSIIKRPKILILYCMYCR